MRSERRHFSRAASCAGLLAALAIVSGCAALKKDEEPIRHFLSIHLFADPAVYGDRLTRVLQSPEGKPVYVRAIPLLSSKCIKKIELTSDRMGNPAVLATVDSHGRMVLMQLCAGYAGRPVAVAVDGIYYFTTRVPRRPHGENTLLIPGPWQLVDAKKLAASSRETYERLNE